MKMASFCVSPFNGGCRTLVLLVLSVAAWSSRPVSAVQPTDAIVKQFGELPVRFNGRVATYDSIARSYLRKLSGREVFFDDEAQQHLAVEWLLDEAAGGDLAGTQRVVPIADPQLLELLKLERRTAPAALQNRYSIREISPSFDALNLEHERIRATPVHQWTDFDRATADLVYALKSSVLLRQSFTSSFGENLDELRAAMDGVERLKRDALPAVVPPRSESNRWDLFAYAALETTIIEVAKPEGFVPNPAYPLIAEIIDARGQRDDKRFAEAVSAYAAYLKEHPPAKAPFDFALPDDWREVGVGVVNEGAFFVDTLADGAAVADFQIGTGTPWCGLRVNYFAGETAPVDYIVNHWRIFDALPPLRPAELQRTLQPVKVDGHAAVSVDIVTPTDFPRERVRQAAIILKRADDTLVFSLSGDPALVEKNRPKFFEFLASVRLGSADEVEAWFDLRQPNLPYNVTGSRILLVMVPDGARTWVFALNGQGEFPQPTRKEFFRLIEEFPTADITGQHVNIGQLDWQPQPVWQAHSDTSDFAAYSLEAEEKFLYVTVNPLANFKKASELPLVNQWRTALELPPLTDKELDEHLKKKTLKERTVRVVEIVAKEAPAVVEPE